MANKIDSLPGARQEQFSDPQIGRLQLAVQTATQQARTCPLVDGVLIQGVQLPGGGVVTVVPHRLGRAWRGYLITSLAPSSIITTAPAQQDTTKYLSVAATVTATVDLWIF